VTQQEVLGLRLLTVHNLYFLLNLTREARDAIRSGTFAAFLDASLSRLASD
jgi:queuine tRNA-ribosyltransferase